MKCKKFFDKLNLKLIKNWPASHMRPGISLSQYLKTEVN